MTLRCKMKQSDFIWFVKQNLKQAQIIQLDNGAVVVKPGGNLLLLYENSQMQLRFVDFNENFPIADKTELRELLIEIVKPNNETALYESLKNKAKKEAT